VDGISYHWQAWAFDTAGGRSLSVPFGENSDSGVADFGKVQNEIPFLPVTLAQYTLNGNSSIPLGTIIKETGIQIRGFVEDPEGDWIRLQVEIQPISFAFTNLPSYSSASTASGNVAFVNLEGLPDGTSYHWQCRVIDSSGEPSGWISFANNLETAIDFRIDVNFTGPPGSRGRISLCGATQASNFSGFLVAGILVVLFLIFFRRRGNLFS